MQRSIRTRNPPIRYELAYTHASVTSIQEPKGYSEALSASKSEQWLTAIALEMKSLEAMTTWTLADGVKLYGSADADWAGNLDDRRSTTGYSSHLQKTGTAISCSTIKQPTAAISTSEAEHQERSAKVQKLYICDRFSMRW